MLMPFQRMRRRILHFLRRAQEDCMHITLIIKLLRTCILLGWLSAARTTILGLADDSDPGVNTYGD